ncbi:MAG TPA: small acid-soluble spore protein SspI [Bacilli bacterium]|nr:small acid-soluble spore protein SspI [Bacilli bacterium]
MDLNLRKAILANVTDNSQEELEATIVDAIQSGEEKMLPGLGVLFELIWQQADQAKKKDLVQLLETGVQHAGA